MKRFATLIAAGIAMAALGACGGEREEEEAETEEVGGEREEEED